MSWLVVKQHSAFEVTFDEFDTETEAREYFNEWSSEYYSLINVFLSHLIDKKTSL